MKITVAKAADILEQGGVVALPTETVYGLAGSALNPQAVEKIFKVKERPYFDPLIVHIGHFSQVYKVVSHWPPTAQKLAEEFWPGPLTILAHKAKEISPLVTANLPTVAVRVPNHPMFLELISAIGPLAAPSANRFGKTSPTTAAHVEQEFAGKLPVVDGGSCDVGIESTIVSIDETKEKILLQILRPGAIGEVELLEALSLIGKPVEVRYSSSKETPGQLKNHYQPDKPLVIAQSSVRWNKALHTDICKNLGISDKCDPTFWDFNSSDPLLVARSLYAELHEHNDKTAQGSYIFLTLPIAYSKPKWVAIRDRVDKACTLKVKKINNMPEIFHKNLAD